MTKRACVACQREIDPAARMCPYCGANPTTGEKVDTQAILQQMFKARELSASESVIEYARHRQGIVIAATCAVIFLVLAALHQFVTMRNDSAVSSAPAVPLTEVTDLQDQNDANKAVPMPKLSFQYDGKPQAMRTFIAEQGATTPPEVLAAQQAAAQAAVQPAPGQIGPGRPEPH
jgi:RNA polymerase subunit RPABC4/transcription elongation factor Spt4